MIKPILSCAALLLVAACSSDGSPMETPTLGDAVRNNMAVHILPSSPADYHPNQRPTPLRRSSDGATSIEADLGDAGVPGTRAALTMDRYMTGKVKPLLNPSSPSSGSGAAAPAGK